MNVIRRITRASRPFRAIVDPSRTLNPRSRTAPSFLCHCIAESRNAHSASEVQRLKAGPDDSRLRFLLPAVLASLLGIGGLQTSHADADNSASRPLPSESPTNYLDLSEMAKKERLRIEETLRSKGLRPGSYPRFTIAIKGQKVSVKFQIPPSCEIPKLIATVVSQLGLKVEQHGGGSDMSVRAWDSAVSWQLKLTNEASNKDEEAFCVVLFGSLVTPDKAGPETGILTRFPPGLGFCKKSFFTNRYQELEFIKQGSLNAEELNALVSVLQLVSQYNTSERKEMPSDKSIASLESMGVKVYGLDDSRLSSSNVEMSWDNLAGYHQQKREIEDTILLALQSPEVYDEIARRTRRKYESNRPRAVLFDGPPGTGKTSSARVIANQAGVPLLYVPLEVVMSKYYGESERLLAKVFSLANELASGALIFLDEVITTRPSFVFPFLFEIVIQPPFLILLLNLLYVDSFAVARDGEMHEATRRVLSVLLRQIDGFEQDKNVVVIAATNRKQDLDPALISRFDSIITFGLPDQPTRQEITSQYAKHLSKSELDELAAKMEEMSGRDIKEVCQQAERTWASKIIRGQASSDGEHAFLPPLEQYIESAANRQKGLSSISDVKPANRSRLVLD